MKLLYLLTALLPTIVSAATAITVTVAPPAATATLAPQVPSACNNTGLQWAYYHTFPYRQPARSTSDYDPTMIKKLIPQAQGNTTYTSLNNPSGNTSPVFGSSAPLPGTLYAINMRGYFLALETGVYTFNSTNVDDVLSLWIGSQAFSGWNNANSQQGPDPSDARPSSNVYYQRLTAGQYYPLRLVFTQAVGPASFNFVVTAPSGIQVLNGDPSSQSSPLVVQYSCDGVLAPQYSSFGQET